MSDGAGKNDEGTKVVEKNIKRAGRARVCTQCKFTTTDVKEFSNHRIHAHAEEKNEEKPSRRSNTRRKASLVAETETVDTEPKAEQTVTETASGIETNEKEQKLDDSLKKETQIVDQKRDLDLTLQEKNSQNTEQETNRTDLNSEQGTNQIDQNGEQMADEQISEEYFSSLSLRKSVIKPEDIKNKDSSEVQNDSNKKRPAMEKTVLEKVNGHREEVLLVNKDDDQDDEPRLVIADDGLNDTDDLGDHSDGLDLSGDHTSLLRSGNIQNRTYMCSHCEVSTTSAKAFLHHQKDAHHLDIIIYECDICEYATKYKQKLPRHRKLHFTGKEGMIESDLDSSLTEREMKEMKEAAGIPVLPVVNGDDDIEDDGDIDEEEEEEAMVVSSEVNQTPNGSAVPEVRKKRIRQEVDPLKYYEVMDDVGVKYACSKCGNVYKWRKSLNKHWKEKHFGETPDLTKPPQALQSYTLFSRYKSKFGAAGQPPAAPNVVYGSAASAAQAAGTTDTLTPKSAMSSAANTPKSSIDTHIKSPVVMPKFIGPFVGGTSQSAYRPNVSPAQMKSLLSQPAHAHQIFAMSEHERKKNELKQIMEAMRNHKQHEKERQKLIKSEALPANSQTEPLDFSKKPEIKTEPAWGDDKFREQMQELSFTMMMQNKANAVAMETNQVAAMEDQPAVLQCTKCSFVAKTLVDYSSHMTLHLNKRAFKCAECQEHFNGVDDLNKHFADNHSEKIEEHKQAIQKIPHGLQQTYHLLKMPLENISTLATQELISNEPKQLKCSMCSFVAKWPAELQKHAVSHSEERPFVCMVCGSTYKWKWDLVKHFEKSHNTLPNPYKRREQGAQSTTHSPSPTLDSLPKMDTMNTLSKTAVALLDAGMTGSAPSHGIEESPMRKRRLSETDMMDDEEFYLMEQQHKRMMAENFEEKHINLNAWKQFKGADLSLPDSGDSEGQNSSDGVIDPASKQRAIADALKQRITNKNIQEGGEAAGKDSALSGKDKNGKGVSDVLLPYKCTICEYRARWPSEISQHMKNHSNEKPYHCPRCSYKSKWKWDVVKHLRRCGGGTVHDVIDTTKMKNIAPPNVMVMPQGNLQKTPQQNAMSQPMFPTNMKFEPIGQPSSVSPVAHSSTASSVAQSLKFTTANGGVEQQESMDYSTSPADIAAQKQNPVFRSLVNQGVYHCLECPFVGNNPAELRRHSVLHSENKPFMCTMCGYSSRWKCDLKKHMKTYGHFNSTQVDSDDAENSPDKYTEMEEDLSDDEQRSTLYMCPKCPYNSYKKQAFELHLKIHGDNLEDDHPTPPVNPVASAKFKCTKCDYQGNDLSSFLQHKVSHNNQPSATSCQPAGLPASGPSYVSTTPAPEEVSNRTLHLKHRRKPVKQFHCQKCPYVCFKRSGMTVHESMHEPRGAESFLCMFCDYNVFSKSLLLQHMRLHPDYCPAECTDLGRVGQSELQEIEELEEKDAEVGAEKSTAVTEENNNIDDFEINNNTNSGDIIDLSKSSASFGSRSSTPADSAKTSAPKNNEGSLPCEWCSSTFPNVVTLYQHAQSMHPMQLKAQEAGDIAAKQNPNPPSQLEQIVKERQREYQVYHQFMAQQQPQIQAHLHTPNLVRRLVPLAPKPAQGQIQSLLSPNQPRPQMMTLPVSQPTKDPQTEITLKPSPVSAFGPAPRTPYQIDMAKAKKSTSQQKRARSFQCTKCSFTAPNAVTYLRHIERHGSNCKHTCLYCDYSIDRLNLLYQHMKGTHGSMWQGTAEEKINLSTEDSNNNLIGLPTDSPAGSCNLSEENSVNDELNESFNSSHNGSNDGDAETRAGFDGGILSQLGAKGMKPVLVIRGETLWRGTPVQVCSLDGRKYYKCSKCLYVSVNGSNTASHVKQHGANRRYQCTQCDYSADNYSIQQHHIETVHLKDPSFIQVAPYNPYMEENNNEQSSLPMKSILATAEMRHADMLFSCPKCPYKSQEKRKLQRHLEHHVYNGKYECQLCDYSVDQYNILRKHAKLHNRKILQGNPTYTMEVDSDDDNSYDEPPIPSQSHSRLETSTDNKTKQQMEDLLTKLRLGNGQLRFKCSTCPYSTYLRSEILDHRLGHIARSMYPCHLCNYSVDQLVLLHQHMRCHEQGKQNDSTSDIQEISLNPFDQNMFKFVQEMPADEEEENEVGDPDMGDKQDDPEVMEFEENIGDESNLDDEVDNDDEAAMLEEELRDSIVGEDSDIKDGVKNLNAEGAFDSDLQFRNHKCQDCPFSSNSNAEYKKHLRLHGVNNKFVCDYCNYSLDRINLLSQHRKLHFQEPDFDSAPPVAKLLNKNHEDYATSLTRVGNDIAYPPSESKSEEKPTEYRYLYQKQAEADNGLMADDKIRYSCNNCPYRCNALKSFKCHMQMHGLTKKYRCDYCNWSTDRLNLLYQHRKVHAKEPNFNPSPGDIVFLNREYALENEKQEVGIVGLALEVNENPFERSDMQHYQMPLKTANGQKLLFCKLCPFKTDSPNTYSYHKKLHLIQARFNCSECSFSINNAESLKEHVKLHRKEKEMMKAEILNTNSADKKRHQCPKCPYSSPNKNLLANHTTMHASGRTYSCNLCDFSADKHYQLQEHIRIHVESNADSDESGLEEIERAIKRSGDTIGPELYLNSPNNRDNDSDTECRIKSDHKCENCPFSTPSKDVLGEHNVHHDIQNKMMCMFCTFSCNKEDELLEHVQVHFGTRVDKEMLRLMKKQNTKRNISKAFNEVEDSAESSKKNTEQSSGEPDSTVNESPKKDNEDKDEIEPEMKTKKVYVCQYCEREFDGKSSMIQHEKQHLVGYQF